MNKAPLVSIVVPVYNVKEYLSECLDSILCQTYTNLEIILVDDGSTDCSADICDKYCKLDNRVSCIHKKNGGLSSSRNTGIEIAKGEYITFIDSDDILLGKEILSRIMETFEAENDIDVVQYDVLHKYTSSEEHKRTYPFTTYYSKKDILEGYLTQRIHVSCCDKVFKTSVFKDIRFPEKQISEDIATIPQIIDRINILKATPIGYYGYRYREGSITNSVLPYKKIVSILKSYSTYLKYAMGYKELRPIVLNVYTNTFWNYLSQIRMSYPEKMADIITHPFFIKLSLSEWLKYSKHKSLKAQICSFILCCFGPGNAMKFQRIFTGR